MESVGDMMEVDPPNTNTGHVSGVESQSAPQQLIISDRGQAVILTQMVTLLNLIKRWRWKYTGEGNEEDPSNLFW